MLLPRLLMSAKEKIKELYGGNLGIIVVSVEGERTAFLQLKFQLLMLVREFLVRQEKLVEHQGPGIGA